jgi:hypothetical protein
MGSLREAARDRCYGVARPREGSRQNGIGKPPRDQTKPKSIVCRVNLFRHPLRARASFSSILSAGADGQAVVCPLLRGSSPTRGVAPKRGLGRALTPAFRAGSLYPLARGCRRSWRGEGWFRPGRCCSTGSGRLDLDLMISGAALTFSVTLYARARAFPQFSVPALMARPWSARCYGVARPREGSRQNGIGSR